MRLVLAFAALCLVSHHSISSDRTSSPPPTRAEVDVSSPDRDEAAGRADTASTLEAAAGGQYQEFSREDICEAIVAAAKAHDIPIGFFARLIWQESGFKTTAVSPAGAQGIAQFMPYTAAEKGLEDPFDPMQALPASARFLRELYEQFGNHGLAAAAYNAGPKRVGDWLARRGRLPKETRTYVFNITGRPPEQWIKAKQDVANLKAPHGTNCQLLAAPILVAQAAQASRWTRQAARPRGQGRIAQRVEQQSQQVSQPQPAAQQAVPRPVLQPQVQQPFQPQPFAPQTWQAQPQQRLQPQPLPMYSPADGHI